MPVAPERREKVDAFVRLHFLWPGCLRLHRAALGGDILRAPVNVLLSPVLLLVRLSGWLCRKAGLRRAGDWLGRCRLLLRTAVAARLEAAIRAELLDGAARTAQGDAALADYSGSRSAVAELTTALVALVVGALAFRALTPGMISMAPGVAETVARATAVAAFPLGETLGGLWYGIFPVGPSPLVTGLTILGLVVLGSVAGAFAGILADPVQAWLGVHRRRLLRLLDAVEAGAEGQRPVVAHEHVLARLVDLSDALLSALRLFRG